MHCRNTRPETRDQNRLRRHARERDAFNWVVPHRCGSVNPAASWKSSIHTTGAPNASRLETEQTTPARSPVGARPQRSAAPSPLTSGYWIVPHHQADELHPTASDQSRLQMVPSLGRRNSGWGRRPGRAGAPPPQRLTAARLDVWKYAVTADDGGKRMAARQESTQTLR